MDRLVAHHLYELYDGVGGEGGLAVEQLVQDAAQGPQVGLVVVGPLVNQLGRHVQRGPLDALQHVAVNGHLLREAEVTELCCSLVRGITENRALLYITSTTNEEATTSNT